MIKKFFIAALLALPMCVVAQTYKFGTVNTQQIFEMMPEKAQAEATMEQVSKKYQTEYEELRAEAQKKFNQFQALEENTPQSIKDLRIQEINEMDRKIKEFESMATQDMQKQNEQLIAPISQKITQAIQAVGSENGFTFIFDLSIPTILYSGATAEDVTPLVKAKLGIK